jgi:hypothetical protein
MLGREGGEVNDEHQANMEALMDENMNEYMHEDHEKINSYYEEYLADRKVRDEYKKLKDVENK